jgi:hypothetical protein
MTDCVVQRIPRWCSRRGGRVKMSAINPRMRSIIYWPGAIGLAALLALTGCKSDNSNNSSRNNDPLVGGTRIPPQNVPVPDRGGVGANGKTDPLMASPTSKPPDKTGVGYTDDPARFKGTYIPSASTMPAALAGNLKDGEELKIDGNENKVPLLQTGAVSPGKPLAQSADLAAIYSELEKYGCKPENRSLSHRSSPGGRGSAAQIGPGRETGQVRSPRPMSSRSIPPSVCPGRLSSAC